MSKRILMTSGPTRAPLDAVRFLSNRSTGRFGTLMAKEALKRGLSVTMVYGAGSETPSPHPRLKLIPVETCRDLARVLKQELCKGYDAVIHAMAVLDFEPNHVRQGKIGSRSRKGRWLLDLRPTPKIIQKIKQWAPKTFLVGFKLEVSSPRTLVARAKRLMRESKADMVVGNFLTEGDDERHAGYLLGPKGRFLMKILGKKLLSKEILRYTIGNIP